MASLIYSKASSIEVPALKQPGRSGTVTPKSESLSLWMTIGYSFFMELCLCMDNVIKGVNDPLV